MNVKITRHAPYILSSLKWGGKAPTCAVYILSYSTHSHMHTHRQEIKDHDLATEVVLEGAGGDRGHPEGAKARGAGPSTGKTSLAAVDRASQDSGAESNVFAHCTVHL